jgi:hypothetical protein
MKRVLSLGAGVQSTTLLLMSCLGELPLLDAAVFADTQWEPAEVYRHLDWLTEFAGKAGVPVYRVSEGNLRADAMVSQVRGTKLSGSRWASMPLYTKNRQTGKRGMIRRQCTSEYKIKPLDRFIKRELLGIKPKGRTPAGSVETWVGISADESGRMRKPHHAWQSLRYPLVHDVATYTPRGLFVSGFTRTDCYIWLDRNNFPRPPRSACIGCPFHSDEEWMRIKSDPVQWADAVGFDHAIRACGAIRGDCFLHRSCVPLNEVEFDVKKNWDGVRDNECLGMCGA